MVDAIWDFELQRAGHVGSRHFAVLFALGGQLEIPDPGSGPVMRRRTTQLIGMIATCLSAVVLCFLAYGVIRDDYRECLYQTDLDYQSRNGMDRQNRPPSRSPQAKKCADKSLLPDRTLN